MFVYIAPSQSSPASRVQNLNPEMITGKTWVKEVDNSRDSIEFIWESSVLSTTIQYGGGFHHAFKAHLLDTSSEGVRSFDLVLADQVHDDFLEALKRTTVKIDLKDYAIPPVSFRIVLLFKTHASIEGTASL